MEPPWRRKEDNILVVEDSTEIRTAAEHDWLSNHHPMILESERDRQQHVEHRVIMEEDHDEKEEESAAPQGLFGHLLESPKKASTPTSSREGQPSQSIV